MRKRNQLRIGDDVYDITVAYKRGAMDMRKSIPYNCNPYRNVYSQDYYDWECGHANESCGEHIRNGVDVIHAPQNGHMH